MKKILITLIVLAGFGFSLGASAATLERNLYFGLQRDTDVMKLQEFLEGNGFFASEPTGNFFSMTLKAVKAYQTQEGLPVTGYVGVMTRARINADLDKDLRDTQEAAILETGTSTPVTQEKIDAILQHIALLQSQLKAQQEAANNLAALNTQVQTQSQSLSQIVQNTTPALVAPAQTSVKVSMDKITISKVSDESFSVKNEGTETVRVNKFTFTSPITQIVGMVVGDENYQTKFAIDDKQFDTLACKGLRSLGTVSMYGNPTFDPCARKDNSAARNEIKPGETVVFQVNQLSNIQKVAGSVTNVVSGSDVAFDNVAF